jgi:beta-mannosidase
MLRRDHLDLVFDGLDTFAIVSLNGQQLLATANAHRQWRVDAKPALKVGRNELLVSIASPVRTLQPMVLKEPNPLPGEYDSAYGDEPKGKQTSPYIRKPKYHYSWDWGPRIINIGVWRPVRLEAWDDARIEAMQIDQEAINDAEARLTARYTLVADTAGSVTLRTHVVGPDGQTHGVDRTVQVAAGENQVTVPLSITNPQRWQPVGYGAQPLYRVRGALIEAGAETDRTERRIGLRKVDREPRLRLQGQRHSDLCQGREPDPVRQFPQPGAGRADAAHPAGCRRRQHEHAAHLGRRLLPRRRLLRNGGRNGRHDLAGLHVRRSGDAAGCRVPRECAHRGRAAGRPAPVAPLGCRLGRRQRGIVRLGELVRPQVVQEARRRR